MLLHESLFVAVARIGLPSVLQEVSGPSIIHLWPGQAIENTNFSHHQLAKALPHAFRATSPAQELFDKSEGLRNPSVAGARIAHGQGCLVKFLAMICGEETQVADFGFQTKKQK